MLDVIGSVNSIKIPEIWQLCLSFIIAVLIVYLIEWLKQPSADIELLPDLVLPDGRKLLKVKVKISKKGWFRKIFPWQNPASYARLKGYIINNYRNEEVTLASFTAKWDTRPEPWDYDKNKPKLELLPAASEPENFLVGDEGTTSVAAKHPVEDHFYIYDANYYVNQSQNKLEEKMLKLRLVFSSSSVSTTKEFMIINGNSTVGSFKLKEID